MPNRQMGGFRIDVSGPAQWFFLLSARLQCAWVTVRRLLKLNVLAAEVGSESMRRLNTLIYA